MATTSSTQLSFSHTIYATNNFQISLGFHPLQLKNKCNLKCWVEMLKLGYVDCREEVVEEVVAKPGQWHHHCHHCHHCHRHCHRCHHHCQCNHHLYVYCMIKIFSKRCQLEGNTEGSPGLLSPGKQHSVINLIIKMISNIILMIKMMVILTLVTMLLMMMVILVTITMVMMTDQTCQSQEWCQGCGDPSPCLFAAHLLIFILLVV